MIKRDLLAACSGYMLFNTPMVQALLDGRKIRTMRLMKPQPDTCRRMKMEYSNHHPCVGFADGSGYIWRPCHKPGDIIYVRETFYQQYEVRRNMDLEPETWWLSLYAYAGDIPASGRWAKRPSIHMPRGAARIFLRVMDVKVQRPQELTREEIISEGIADHYTWYDAEQSPCGTTLCNHELRDKWASLWDSVQQKKDLPMYGYDANPFCWVYELERLVPDGGN